jgi:hypothetical protein
MRSNTEGLNLTELKCLILGVKCRIVAGIDLLFF